MDQPERQTYISMAPTTELYNLLKYCMDNNRWESYAYVVDDILKEFELRYVPEAAIADVVASWKQFLKENPDVPRSREELLRRLLPKKTIEQRMEEHRQWIRSMYPDWFKD